MKRLNRKGFTLIELLAVIVILGILMLTAIPAVTRAIAKSRRNTFWQNAKQYIQAVQTPLISGEYYKTTDQAFGKDVAVAANGVCGLPSKGNVVAVPVSTIELEGGTKSKSSFGIAYASGTTKCRPYVFVKNVTSDTNVDKYVWYFAGTDTSGNGIKTPTSESDLSISSVTLANATSSCTQVAPDTGGTTTYCASV